MKIIISDVNEATVNVDFEYEPEEKGEITFPEIFSRMVSAMEGVLSTTSEKMPEDLKQQFFDNLDMIFTNLLYKVFPDIDPTEFDLSDAAIVYAQDQIIQKAEKEGKTYNEMLKEYEDLAEKYIEERRLS